jgi:hypothetical protein
VAVAERDQPQAGVCTVPQLSQTDELEREWRRMTGGDPLDVPRRLGCDA